MRISIPRLLILSCILILTYPLKAQVSWYWAKTADSANETATYDAVDNNNNAFYTGYFNGGTSVAFGGGVRVVRTGSPNDFLVKYDPNGNPLWARGAKELAASGVIYGEGVATDQGNNAIEAGYFNDSIAFGTFHLATKFEAPFVVKYDPNGNVLWAHTEKYGNSFSDVGNYVAADKHNNVFLTGNFTDTLMFGNDTLVSTHADAFLVKYDALGNVKWAVAPQPNNNQSSLTSVAVAVDDSGNSFISGTIVDSVKFGPSVTILSTPLTIETMYIAKYDSNGHIRWAVDIPVATGDYPNPLAVDKSGNVYGSSQFSNTSVVIGPSTITDHGGGCSNSMIVKLDRNGTILWAQCARNVSTAEICVIVESSVAVDKCNNVYWSGICSDTFSIGNVFVTFPGANVNTSTPFDYIIKLDSNGNPLGAAGVASQYYTSYFTNGLAIDNQSRVLMDGILGPPTIVEVGNDTMRTFGNHITSYLTKFSIGQAVFSVPNSDSICAGDSVILSVTNQANTTYQWSTGSTKDTIIVKPPVTTNYYVVITNGCSSDTSFVKVTVTPIPVVSVTPPADTICIGGTASLLGNGASNYIWSPSSGLSCTACPNPTATPTATTTYSVMGTTHGCRDSSKIKVVVRSIPPHSIISVPSSDSICKGDSVHLTATGGVSYVWTPGNSTANNIYVKPIINSSYSLAISFGVCNFDTTINIKIKPVPVVTINPSPSKICQGDTVTLTATGGGTYKWSNNATTSSIKVNPASTTSYTVLVDKGCVNSDSTKVTVNIPSLNVCCDDTISPGASTTLYASGAKTYIWIPATGLNCTTCPNPIATPPTTTTYTVASIDSNGCPSSRTVTVTIEIPCSDFKVPNVFTPNNDGINDDFVINVINPSSYDINIFDRWGKLVYTSTNVGDYWNGRYNGTDYLVPDGVYYYTIKASCGTHDYVKQGFVEVAGEK